MRNFAKFFIGVMCISIFALSGYGETEPPVAPVAVPAGDTESEQVLDSPPQEALVLLIAGRALEEKDPTAAVAKYEEAIIKMKGIGYSGWVYFMLGEIFRLRTQEYPKAIEAYEKAIRTIAATQIKDEKALNTIKERLTLLRFNVLQAMLPKYYLDEVEYPETLAGLIRHGLVPKKTTQDGWGRPFAYTAKSMESVPQFKRQRYELMCNGPDGTKETKDDILPAAFKQGFGPRKNRFAVKGRSQIGGKVSVFIKEETWQKSELIGSGTAFAGGHLFLANMRGAVIAYGAVLEIIVSK